MSASRGRGHGPDVDWTSFRSGRGWVSLEVALQDVDKEQCEGVRVVSCGHTPNKLYLKYKYCFLFALQGDWLPTLARDTEQYRTGKSSTIVRSANSYNTWRSVHPWDYLDDCLTDKPPVCITCVCCCVCMTFRVAVRC